ncbi:MAG: energy transducer TonB [Bacteroidales bacterium]|nr:energy transducer TonB [Bacteroidales bacterium]
MEENDKIQDLFIPSGCLSNYALMRYVEGKLNPQEKKLADLHLKDCELCSDALTGYRNLSSPSAVIPGVTELNRWLHKRFISMQDKGKKERMVISLFSVAAMLILLVGLFFLFRQREIYTEKTLADARYDTATIPGAKTLQPVPRTEAETTLPPVRKLVARKEKKFMEMASTEAYELEQIEIQESTEPVILDDMAMTPDDDAIRNHEMTLPVILTDCVIISATVYEAVTQAQTTAGYTRTSKKSTPARAERVSAEQVAMKAETIMKEETYGTKDEMPQFMEGDINRFLSYIKDNLTYPAEAVDAGIEGQVMIHFVINESGELTDARIIQSCNPLLDSVALRVVTASPLWKAGKLDGNPVRVGYTVPVVFSLKGD